MSRILTASDRTALIRLASSLPKGSPERKAILAGLSSTSRTAASDPLVKMVDEALGSMLVGTNLDHDAAARLDREALDLAVGSARGVLTGMKAWALSEADELRQARLLLADMVSLERKYRIEVPALDVDNLHGESAYIADLCRRVFLD